MKPLRWWQIVFVGLAIGYLIGFIFHLVAFPSIAHDVAAAIMRFGA